MAGKLGLGLGLGIDFKALDSDLNKVADRIEQTGKAHSLKLGATVADVASGKMDPEKLGAMFAQVGTKLSSGLAAGVRASGTLMTGLAAHINTVLDRLAGASITMFQRIDASMKFPVFDTAMQAARLKLTNFTKIFNRGPLSDLDVALGGGMGKVAQTAAKILKVLFDAVTSGMRESLDRVVSALEQVVAKIGQLGGEAKGAVPLFTEMAAQAQKAATATSAAIPPRGAVPGVGRRIGFGTQFTAPPPPATPTYGLGDPRRGPINASALEALKQAAPALRAIGQAAAIAGRTVLQFGAAFVSVPLRGVIALGRMRNFLSSLGDVGKKSFHDLYESHGLFVGTLLVGARATASLAAKLLNLATLGAFRRQARDAGAATQAVRQLAAAGNQSSSVFRRLGGVVQSVGVQIAAAFGFVGLLYKTVTFLRDGILAASNLNETVSRSKVVFGDAFGKVEAQASAISKAFGLTRDAQLGIASGFGAMAQGAGMSEAASADLANTMTQLAADLSSSVNISFEEAGQSIRSALAGQSEPLRRFGVMLTEDRVKAYALAHGLAAGKGELSEHAKMTARAALVMEGLAYAQGDLVRTSGQAANQFRRAGGGLSEFAERVGEIFLPATKAITTAFNDTLAGVLDFLDRNRADFAAWGDRIKIVSDFVVTVVNGLAAAVRQGLVETFGPLLQRASVAVGWLRDAMTTAFNAMGIVVRNFPTLWKIAQLEIGAFVTNAGRWVMMIPKWFEEIYNWVGPNWNTFVQALGTAIEATFNDILDNAMKFGDLLIRAMTGKLTDSDVLRVMLTGKLMPGFESTVKAWKDVFDQLPSLSKPSLLNVQGMVDELMKQVIDAEAKLKGLPGGADGKKKPSALEPPKESEYKLASAVEINSKEAYSAIARNASGGRGMEGTLKLGVKAQQQTVTEVQGLRADLAKAPKPTLVVK